MSERVNSIIKDAVSTTNVAVGASAPAQALGNLYESVSHSTAQAASNAVASQQQANVMQQATTTVGATLLYTMSSAAGGKAANNAGEDAPSSGTNQTGGVSQG